MAEKQKLYDKAQNSFEVTQDLLKTLDEVYKLKEQELAKAKPPKTNNDKK